MTGSRASIGRACRALLLCAAWLCLASPAGAVGNSPGLSASLTDLRVGVHPDHTRIVIETDAKAPYVIDPTDREVMVHVDAAATAEAVTAKSPHLVWVKVEPTGLGTDVRIQLKQPVDVKSLVLTNPDRIVLDLYPKRAEAPTPLPAPVVLPEAAPPVVAEAEPEAEPELEPGPEAPPEGESAVDDEPGLPLEEDREEPLVLELPEEDAGEPAEGEPSAESPELAEPAEPGAAPEPELAGEPELAPPAGARPGQPSAPARRPAAPPAPEPEPGGSRFGSPFAFAAVALVLFALFVWLRRRMRAAEDQRFTEPPELDDAEPFPPPERAVAVGEEPGTGESVFDVEPEAVAPGREEVPTLRPPLATGLDGEDEASLRLTHVEKRIEELVEAKERLERQVAAQTEELRVQRAAIARTQRVLRSIAPKTDDEPSEPLVRS